jgi:hypothetical protein
MGKCEKRLDILHFLYSGFSSINLDRLSSAPEMTLFCMNLLQSSNTPATAKVIRFHFQKIILKTNDRGLLVNLKLCFQAPKAAISNNQ